jgi:GntR family transcriptional regulator
VPIRYDDQRPPYLQVAAELRGAIEAGQYSPGDRLPSTRALADEYGIAPTTVQHAMRILRDEGLVVAQPGRAAFVQGPKDKGHVDEPRTLDEAKARIAALEAQLDEAISDLARANELLDATELADLDTPPPPGRDADPGLDR